MAIRKFTVTSRCAYLREFSMSLAAALRRELAVQAERYAQSESIPHCFSYGEAPVLSFSPYDTKRNGSSGNIITITPK